MWGRMVAILYLTPNILCHVIYTPSLGPSSPISFKLPSTPVTPVFLFLRIFFLPVKDVFSSSFHWNFQNTKENTEIFRTIKDNFNIHRNSNTKTNKIKVDGQVTFTHHLWHLYVSLSFLLILYYAFLNSEVSSKFCFLCLVEQWYLTEAVTWSKLTPVSRTTFWKVITYLDFQNMIKSNMLPQQLIKQHNENKIDNFKVKCNWWQEPPRPVFNKIVWQFSH